MHQDYLKDLVKKIQIKRFDTVKKKPAKLMFGWFYIE